MEKLIGNLNKMVWKNIRKLSEAKLEETEKEIGLKFPKEDRKYIKAYNNGKGENIYIYINEEKIKVDLVNFKLEIYKRSIDLMYKELEGTFKDEKLMPIMWNVIFMDEETGISKNIINHLIVYDYTKNIEEPEIVYITYKEQYIEEEDEYEIIKGTLKREKIGNKLSDLLQNMYVSDEVEKETVGWLFEETATKEEIEKFQKKLGIRFPSKYEELLNEAREKGVTRYPEKFIKEFPENVVGTGGYMTLEEIESTYEIYLECHAPYPKKLIPIKECGGGDNICLDYRGKLNTTLKEPKITYYVHDEIGRRRFIHLADSYDEFLSIIEIDEEEVEAQQKEIDESYYYGEQTLEE